MLNSKEIIEEGIVTGATPSCIQQVGIDLQVVKIDKIVGIGSILVSKTMLPAYEEHKKQYYDIVKATGWYLLPGTYQVTFAQGCKIPLTRTLLLRQRSSLLRSGVTLHSSVFDPGFETGQIGSFMTVNIPIFIEEEARICQAYVHPNTEVVEGYDGQFQKDKQRKTTQVD